MRAHPQRFMRVCAACTREVRARPRAHRDESVYQHRCCLHRRRYTTCTHENTGESWCVHARARGMLASDVWASDSGSRLGMWRRLTMLICGACAHREVLIKGGGDGVVRALIYSSFASRPRPPNSAWRATSARLVHQKWYALRASGRLVKA